MPNRIYRVEDQNDWSVFRDRLQACMENNHFNMSSLADAADLNVTSISRYFQGRIPDIIAMWRLADTFGVSIDWLCGRTPTKHENITAEQKDILDKFLKASPEDKKIVALFLSKYE